MARHITILYKSGAQFDFVADEFEITMKTVDSATLHSAKWKGANPAPLYLGINEIAAVWDNGEVDRG